MNDNQPHTSNGLRRLPPVLLVLLSLTVCLTLTFPAVGKGKKADWDSQARLRKADFVFATGAGAVAMDSMGTGIMMMDYASLLNPADPDIAANLALVMAGALNIDDTVKATKLYRSVRDAWLLNPDDYDRGFSVAEMAGHRGNYNDLVRIWTILDSLYPKKDDPALNLAQAYAYRYIYTHDTADYNRSLRIYNRIERGVGRDLGLTSQKVRVYQLRGDTTAIFSEVDSLVREMPRDARTQLYAGLLNESFGKDTVALEYYRRAAAIDSADGMVIMRLAKYYNDHGDSVAYDREVFRALENPGLPFSQKQDMLSGYLTDIYHDSLQWPRIERMFSVLERVNGDEPGLHLIMGVFQVERERWEQAREQFEYAAALDPANDRTLEAIIHTELEMDSLDAVIATGRRGMELFPDNFSFPIVTANALREQKRYQDGIDVLRSVPLTDVRNKKAVSNLVTVLGDIYYSAGQTDSAFTAYERALAYDRENWGAYNNAAYFIIETGRDLDKAERYASYACAAEPENTSFLDTYAWVFFKKRDYTKAAEYMVKALETIEVVESDTTQTADSAQADTSQTADSVQTADTVAANNTDARLKESGELVVPNVGANKIKNLEKRGERLAANEHWTDIEKHDDMFVHAGDIFFMFGRPDIALTFWQKALKLRPDDELLQRKVKNKAYYYE